MGNRTNTWNAAIITRVASPDETTVIYVIEPGDATSYRMILTRIDGELASHAWATGHVVTVTNLRDHPVSMFVRNYEYISWEDVREALGIAAEGSCWMITEILAFLIGTRCDTYQVFEEKYRKWYEKTHRPSKLTTPKPRGKHKTGI